MEIKVLGTGCSTCKALYATVEKVMKETGINATLVKEEDMEQLREVEKRGFIQIINYEND